MARTTNDDTVPAISVIQRRLLGDDPFRLESAEVPMVDPNKTVRWINGDINPDRLYNVRARGGWTFCTPEDLACRPEEVGAVVTDGVVVRGERGREVLAWMYRDDYARLQAKKDAANRRALGGQATKQAIVGAAEREMGSDGDRVASYLNENLRGVTVRDSRERQLED